jgi:glycosyltransferase involved in cell wall biosynthesis
MRIAYITYEYPPDFSGGGIATYVAQAAQTMAARSHEVEVFASSPSRSGRFDTNGILEHRIKEIDRQDFGIVAGHVFALRHAENPFDVLEGPEFNADARKAVELVPEIPLVVKMHTPSSMIAALNAPSGVAQYFKEVRGNFRSLVSTIVRRRALRSVFFKLKCLQSNPSFDAEGMHARKADLVAPPCCALCNHAKIAWDIPEEAIRLSPNPYRPAKAFLALQPRAQGFTVGFVGRLERRKGIETLTAAIPHVLNAVPEATFRFIGSSIRHPESGIPYDEWVQQRTPRYQGRLEFAGKHPLEHMAEAYDGLDICVFPSLWENFPNVCLEAMSAARAIVASDSGGMSEMLDHGRVGCLVTPGNAAVLAHEIISLLKSPSERIRLGEMARKRVLEVYNEKVIGCVMEDIYRDAIERKGRHRQDCESGELEGGAGEP